MTVQNCQDRFYVSLISCQVRVVIDIYLISWNACVYSQLHTLTVRRLLIFFLTFFLASLVTLFLTYLLTFFLIYFVTFFLTFLLTFFLAHLPGILSDILSHILSDISSDICLTFFLTKLLTYLLAFFLTFYLEVEVRQGTLGSDDLRWGPAGNTGRGCLRLRSGREGWGGGGGGGREATNIKSNNPHLTRGE